MNKKPNKTSKSAGKTVTKPLESSSGKIQEKTGPNALPGINYYWIGIGIVIFVVSLIRIRLLEIPLERDEGEYAYLGKLILEGIPPYKEAYNMKLPGTYYMYALLMGIFGKSITGVHTGLLIVNISSIILFFLAFKKLFNASIGLITSAVFGIMAISPSLLGFAAHATHFVTLFVAAGTLFLAYYNEKRTILYAFLTGLMFGLSFLMKQQAVFFILFAGIAILLVNFLDKPIKIVTTIFQTIIFSLGVLIPYGLIVLILIVSGVFDKFWFWTFEYASKYAAGVSFEDGKMLFGMSFKPMWDEFMFFWILAFAGLIIVFISKLDWKQKIIAIMFALFAFLTICPGFYFRQHYFVPLLPAVGLLVGISLDYIARQLKNNLKLNFFSALPFIIVVLISASAIAKGKVYYTKSKPALLSRMIYGTNPFLESVEIGKFIKENSKEGDKIAILGSEPQIFLYADRNSATGYIYTYGLMEIHDYNKKMHLEMIAEIEKQKPKFLVFCRIHTSWLARPGSPTEIFDWFNKYSVDYDLVGVADIVAQNQTNYMWNDDAKRYQPQSQEYVLVYKKK